MSQTEIEAAFASQAAGAEPASEPEPVAATEPPADAEPGGAAAPFVITADAVPTGAADAPADSHTHTSIAGLFAQYGKYVALFVGAGLISGSVVHFPLAPVRYAIIGAVGALVFAIASVVSEFGDRDPLRLVRVAVSSLALALGIGMISGGIQHFMDIPDRAALLIPLGVVLSLAAFGIRHNLILKRIDLALMVPWLVIGVFGLGFGSASSPTSPGRRVAAPVTGTQAAPTTGAEAVLPTRMQQPASPTTATMAPGRPTATGPTTRGRRATPVTARTATGGTTATPRTPLRPRDPATGRAPATRLPITARRHHTGSACASFPERGTA